MHTCAAVELNDSVLSGAVPMIILGGFLLVLAAVLLLAWFFSDRRRTELRAVAMKLGWSFKHEAGARVEAALHEFSGFGATASSAAMSTLTGWLKVGHRRLPAVMGDHDPQEEPRGSKPRGGDQQGSFSYLAVRLPAIDTPELIVRREGLKDLVARAVVPAQVDLESAEFNRRFFVRCDRKKFAFDVLHPRMMEFLLQGKAPMVEVRGGWICLTDGARRWRPSEFIARVSWAEQFLSLWPEYLWQDLQTA